MMFTLVRLGFLTTPLLPIEANRPSELAFDDIARPLIVKPRPLNFPLKLDGPEEANRTSTPAEVGTTLFPNAPLIIAEVAFLVIETVPTVKFPQELHGSV